MKERAGPPGVGAEVAQHHLHGRDLAGEHRGGKIFGDERRAIGLHDAERDVGREVAEARNSLLNHAPLKGVVARVGGRDDRNVEATHRAGGNIASGQRARESPRAVVGRVDRAEPGFVDAGPRVAARVAHENRDVVMLPGKQRARDALRNKTRGEQRGLHVDHHIRAGFAEELDAFLQRTPLEIVRTECVGSGRLKADDHGVPGSHGIRDGHAAESPRGVVIGTLRAEAITRVRRPRVGADVLHRVGDVETLAGRHARGHLLIHDQRGVALFRDEDWNTRCGFPKITGALVNHAPLQIVNAPGIRRGGGEV